MVHLQWVVCRQRSQMQIQACFKLLETAFLASELGQPYLSHISLYLYSTCSSICLPFPPEWGNCNCLAVPIAGTQCCRFIILVHYATYTDIKANKQIQVKIQSLFIKHHKVLSTSPQSNPSQSTHVYVQHHGAASI